MSIAIHEPVSAHRLNMAQPDFDKTIRLAADRGFQPPDWRSRRRARIGPVIGATIFILPSLIYGSYLIARQWMLLSWPATKAVVQIYDAEEFKGSGVVVSALPP